MTTDTATRLLDSAESRMREGGFHAVSFRDLAGELGIKSASVHYYFPKKEDLGIAVLRRYRERLMETLADAASPHTKAAGKLDVTVESFRKALMDSRKVCLCGLLGAEVQGLPGPVRAEVAAFLTDALDWFEAIFRLANAPNPRVRAALALSALEGAMILAVTLDDPTLFDGVAAEIRALVD